MMIDLDAPIRDVTVYADRALVTRRGSTHLEAGEHELRVYNLPQFLRDSLRAAGRGPQGTRILNVDLTTAFHSQPPEADLLTLKEALEQLQQQRELLKARQTALNDRRQWLRALGEQSRDFARGLAQGQMKPNDCAEFFSFMAQQALQDAEASQGLDLQLKRLQQDIDAKQRELDQKQGSNFPDRLAAVVTVTLAEAGDVSLELSYLITGASWYPQYDVRVQMNEGQSSGEVELTYIGLVQQTTGERWENVALSLSTARPSLAAVLPDLDPLYLSIYSPPLPIVQAYGATPMMSAPAGSARMMRQAKSLAGEAFTDAAEDEEPKEILPTSVAADIATTTVERTGTALVFHVGRSVDIPSDNSPHKTTIARDSLPCTFDYVSAPVLEENTHLRATITNTTERMFLAGEASIFLSSDYVGTTKVKMTAPTETFKIFLGIDDSIKVRRELLERAVEKGNILQSDIRRITYAYRITVHNYATLLKRVVVHDHLPVPQHERIKLKALGIQPAPTERTKLELLTWEFPLPADGEQKIDYRFVIEHPQGARVIGLP